MTAARLNAPYGASATADDLHTADFNNHAIRRLDLESAHTNTDRIDVVSETTRM